MKDTILVVDDDRKIRKLCSVALHKRGFDITTVKDAEDARAAHARKHYDLALVDIVMPKTNGLELLQELKKVNQDDKIRIEISKKSRLNPKVANVSAHSKLKVSKPLLTQSKK